MSNFHHHGSRQEGFTLLEVIITISLLTFMAISISTLMRSSVDMRLGLSEQAKVTSRLNTAMELLRKDLLGTYMLSVNYDKATLVDGATPTYFRVDTFGEKTTISFTTMNGITSMSDQPSGELIEVSYELKTSELSEDRLALYRGEKVLGFKGDIETELVTEGIAYVLLEMWNGEGWTLQWNTDKSRFKQSIPHLVRLTIRAYPRDPMDEDGPEEFTAEEIFLAAAECRTMIYLPWARRYSELKQKPKTLRF